MTSYIWDINLLRDLAIYDEHKQVSYPNADLVKESLKRLNIEYEVSDNDLLVLKQQEDIAVYIQKYPVCKFVKTLEGAVAPGKTHESDVGYDLTIVHLVKDEGWRRLYDTGLKLEIPRGYYIEVVPRSSFSKTGWILSNGIGVIDRDYRGNILVSVTRVRDDPDPLALPYRGFQMIVRIQERLDFQEAEADEMTDTARGTGGFGSTG